MSSGLSLEFHERADGEWYYLIEEESAPEDVWDWRDFAELIGPFPSLDAARHHNIANYPNTGHETRVCQADYQGQIEKYLENVVAPDSPRFAVRTAVGGPRPFG